MLKTKNIRSARRSYLLPEGTATTVGRAIKITESGYLDDLSIVDLANRLGIGTRHLSILLRRYVGLGPKQFASTHRIQVAKRLRSDTNIPLAQVAFEAGFGSVRRFNDAFRKTYKCEPSSIRRSRGDHVQNS